MKCRRRAALRLAGNVRVTVCGITRDRFTREMSPPAASDLDSLGPVLGRHRRRRRRSLWGQVALGRHLLGVEFCRVCRASTTANATPLLDAKALKFGSKFNVLTPLSVVNAEFNENC